MSAVRPLGSPRRRLASTGSTNDVARELAAGGAPHGTVVTAEEQTAGRGRQGRGWVTAPGEALAASVVVRDLDAPGLLPLAVAVAAAGACGDDARIKWPNDVVRVAPDGTLRKLAGILCEARAGEAWAVAGVGVNVAVDVARMPEELAARAGSLGLAPDDRERVLDDLLGRLALALALAPRDLLAAWSERDVLRGAAVRWDERGTERSGTADGVDAGGGLRVLGADGELVVLDAGEVHLARGIVVR